MGKSLAIYTSEFLFFSPFSQRHTWSTFILSSPPPHSFAHTPISALLSLMSSPSSAAASVALRSLARSVSTLPCQPRLRFNPSAAERPLCFVLGLKIKGVRPPYQEDLMSEVQGINQFAGLLMAGRSELGRIKEQQRKKEEWGGR